jgi:D-threo-aldose 1-dehydrogenase
MTGASSAAPARRPHPLSLQWPKLGLGCASLGAPPPGLADAAAEAVMTRAIERGIRFFDVAPLYGGGLGEARLGRALQGSGLRRDDYVLCTKTGVTRPFGQGPIPPGGTRRREGDVWDYSERATRASIATSLERLGVDRLDVVHLHDAENHLDVCLEAWSTLDALRDAGVVCGIGIGSNLPQPVATLLERAQFDAFLLAGRYTLLDQSGAALFARAADLGVRVVAGGVFNSGVLAAWPPTSATFDYVTAEPDVVERTGRIAAICAKHGVPLGAAALQFVMRHPAVTTVLLGPRSVAELDRNLAAATHPIPDVLWVELRAAGLLPENNARAQRARAPAAVEGATDAH